MDISEVARRSGIPASALRYYEEKGLIASSQRHGLRRQYAETVLAQLALISLGQQAGFSLYEITPMLASSLPQIDREKLLRKANQLDQQIKQLSAIRDALQHAAACRAEHHMACPKFQTLLKKAERRRQRQNSSNNKLNTPTSA